MPIPEGSVVLGTIEVSYYLDPLGESMTHILYPEFDAVPAIIQAGMLAYAQHSLLTPDRDD